MREALETLTFAVQYRPKYGGRAWHTIAAFDREGPAEWYLSQQRRDLPYEYRMVDLRTDIAAKTAGQTN